MWGEHLAFSKTFTAVVARLVSLFGLSMVDCWVNVYRLPGCTIRYPSCAGPCSPRDVAPRLLCMGSARDGAAEAAGSRLRVSPSLGPALPRNGEEQKAPHQDNYKESHLFLLSVVSSEAISISFARGPEPSAQRHHRPQPGRRAADARQKGVSEAAACT